ncbi:hypothetical protein ATANTOWER_023484 [Ataeniobius toweri]|uniref:Uncharacterized protein n=1 Tax=Ataeniobius toweri TaxID=208326 RepID=A0ABU7B1N1_9TELE|nr:hypothetical protein [Ataeniobius toweri]
MVNPVGRRKPPIPCEACSLIVLSSFHVFSHFSCKFTICCFLCLSGKSLAAAYKNRFSRRTWISQRFWPKQEAPSPPATTCLSSVKSVTHRTLLTTWTPSLSTHRSITTRITGLLFSLNLALSPESYLSVHHNGKDMYHLC